MIPFTFRCPTSSLIVQGFTDDRAPAGDYYEAVECTACNHIHFVNPLNGSVMRAEADRQKTRTVIDGRAS